MKKKKFKVTKRDVERLIAAILQDIKWDDRDIMTFDAINKGEISWSGDLKKQK
jgi:hypothetical protein